MRIDVTSAFTGYTSALVDLYQMVGDTGWSVKKVKFDKKLDRFVAEASNPHGETVAKNGPTEEMAVRNLLLAVTRKNHMRTGALTMFSMWQYNWIDQMKPIAEAYAKGPLYDPKGANAYKALADDSDHRAKMLREQLEIEETHEPQPYAHVQAMADDIHKRRKLVVSRANSEHPVWTPEQVVNYRIAHNVLGHAVAGSEFGWEGTNHAVQAHMPLLPSEAQKALFTEAIAQPAYANMYHQPLQKIALLPQFYEPAQRQEGVSEGYPGTHPSQSFAPVAMPAIKPINPKDMPYSMEALGLGGMTHGASIDPTLRDPNDGWQSGIIPPEPNAYYHHGDPLEGEAVMGNARKLDTEWSSLPDKHRQKEAVENALRVVLLSPLQEERWNAIHYQDLLGNRSTNPVDLWNTLEKKRQDWNVKNFGESARLAHRPYHELLPRFESIIYQMNPHAGRQAARQKAGRIFFAWETEEQERLRAEEGDLPEDKRMNHYEIENAVNKALSTRLKLYTKEYQPKLDRAAKVEAEPDMLFPELEPQLRTPKLDRYGAFMGSHLKAIAQIGLHADELLRAGLADVHEHGGTGHHFRSALMQLGIPGLGPKSASFAWHLLQPMTSQLATIDHHAMDALGKNHEKEMNNRDYFKFERELAAGRDAAGYGHIPLGAFQGGMRDMGNHQDLSHLRVLDPTSHDAIDWQAKPLLADKFAPQDWWMQTQPYRDEVGEDWDEFEAPTKPKNRVPYKTSKVSATLRKPWFTHPYSGERLFGEPGQTLMQHLTQTMNLSTPEIWELVSEAGKS